MTDASANPFDAIGFEPGSAPPPVSSPPSSTGTDPGADDHEITVHPLSTGQAAPPSSAAVTGAAASTTAVTGSAGGPATASSSANPFDAIGFDGAPQPSSDAPTYGTGVLSNAPNDGVVSGTLKNIGSTTIRGLSHAPGFVGDIRNFADTLTELPEYVESKITGQPFADVVAKRSAMAAQSEAQQDQFEKGLFGFSIDPRHLPSGSDISNAIARYAGSYQPTSTLGKYGSAAGEAALGAFGPGGGSMLAGVAEHALPNAAAGIASQAVADRTDDPLLASLAGIGASGIAGAAKGAPARKAASILAGAADDPTAAVSTIAAGDPDAVPGVPQTTAEMTGDPGLYRLQSQVAEQNPAVFDRLRAAQNQGRLAALDSLMPDGDPQDVARHFSQQFDDIGDRAQALVDSHQAAAQAAASALPGQGLPTDAYGALLRSNLADAETARSDAEGKLWDAVDPDNSLTNDLTGIKQANANIYSAMPAADRAFMSPAESAFSGLIDGYNNVEPFRQVASLKSNLASAMRQELRENGSTPAYARMSKLMGPVQDAISGTVARRAAADDAAVAAGQMGPGNTLAAKIRGMAGDYLADQGNTGTDLAAGVATAGARAAAGFPDLPRAQGESGQRSRATASHQAISRDVSSDVSQIGPAGNVTPAYFPGGVLGVRHELAEHGNLITSHDANFRPRPEFPAKLQPRARDSAGARDQVNGIAARLQPERLGPSPEANSGAPIVGPDNVVESGNGRTMAIGKAYDAGRGNQYRQHLENLGFDTAGYSKPVLIRRRVTPMTPDEREFFTHAANNATALRMGSAEQAAADAKHISSAVLDSQDGPNIASASNRRFVGNFLAKLPAAERGALVDQQGNLSQAGVRRIQAAMAANAYSDHGVISRAFDDADSNIKGLAGALVDASGPWAKMRAAASRGEISPGHDVTPELMSAVKIAMRSRDEGRPIGEALRQGDLFNSETSRLVAGMITRDGEKLASRPQIEAALRNYADEATKNASGARLFGEAAPVGDVLRASQAKVERETGSAPAAPVFSDVPPPATANMNDAAAARYQAANQATKDRARLFGAKPIADVLAEKGGRGNFKLPASAVPGKLFPKGPGGFEAVQAFRDAVNDEPAAMHVLRDHAVDSMRRDVMTADGTLPEAKLEKWRADHADALRAFPELAQQFRDAGAATTAFETAAAQRRQLIKTYEKSAFGSLMNATHPEQVGHIVASLLKSPTNLTTLRRLTDAVSADPMAAAGLRRAVLDHVVEKHVSDIETASGPQRNIKAKAFRDYVLSRRSALETVLGKPSAEMLHRIANSLPHATHSLETAGQAKLADLSRYLKAATRPHETLGERLFKVGFVAHEIGEGVGELFGGEHGGIITAALAASGMIGKKVMNAVRATGARKVGDLITDATLHPDQYAALVSKAPIRPDVGSEQMLAAQMRRAAMFGTDAMTGVTRHVALRAARFNEQTRDERRREKRRPQQRAVGGIVPSDDEAAAPRVAPENTGSKAEPGDADRKAADESVDRHLDAYKRARGGLVAGGGPFGVPTYGQALAPTKRAMGHALGFADGGAVDRILATLPRPSAVEQAMNIIAQDRRKVG